MSTATTLVTSTAWSFSRPTRDLSSSQSSSSPRSSTSLVHGSASMPRSGSSATSHRETSSPSRWRLPTGFESPSSSVSTAPFRSGRWTPRWSPLPSVSGSLRSPRSTAATSRSSDQPVDPSICCRKNSPERADRTAETTGEGRFRTCSPKSWRSNPAITDAILVFQTTDRIARYRAPDSYRTRVVRPLRVAEGSASDGRHRHRGVVEADLLVWLSTSEVGSSLPQQLGDCGSRRMRSLYFSGSELRFVTDDVDGRRRLREAIGHLLQVHQLCVLVGSGASVHLGSPRIRGVDATDVLGMATRAGLTVDHHLESLIRALVSTDADLEDFLGQLVAARNYASAFNLLDVAVRGTTCTTDDLERVFKAVNLGLAWACDLPRTNPPPEPPFDIDPLLAHREFFRRLIASRRPDAPRIRIFTTNYDTLIERSLDQGGIQYFDGFVGTVRRRIELASYEQDLYSTPEGGSGSLRRVHDVVHLYKLHGSLTWRAERTPAIGTTTIVQSDGPPREDEVAVIYPTPTKEVDVLGHPYSDFLRSFSNSLIRPECALISVGYGFADEHINRIIFDALSVNPSLQLLAADPSGVVEDGAPVTPGSPIARSEKPVGRLSGVKDARISILTGNDASFTELVDLLPDVSEMNDIEREELRLALASALLPPAAPSPPAVS